MGDNLIKIKGGDKFYCSYVGCDAVFTRMYRAQRHLRKHSNEKPFICTIDNCEKAFTCRTYLNKHLKRPHKADDQKEIKKQKSYKCEYCDKIFKHKFNLKIHIAQHDTNLNEFKCSLCEKSFAIKSRLIRHEKMHKGYNCNHDDCEFTADKWTILQKHIATEHRPTYKCEKCTLVFIKPSGLAAHLLTHEDIKHFVCSYNDCGKEYLNKSNLRVHIKTVHENQVFKCCDCQNEYRYRVTLKRHMKVHENAKPNISNGASVKEKKLFIKRTSMASKLSGEKINELELKNLLIEDKEFRKKVGTNI